MVDIFKKNALLKKYRYTAYMTTGDVGVNEFLYGTEYFSRISYKRHKNITNDCLFVSAMFCHNQYVSFVLTLEGRLS